MTEYSEHGYCLLHGTMGNGTIAFTLCRLNELPHAIYWKILISIIGMSGYMI